MRGKQKAGRIENPDPKQDLFCKPEVKKTGGKNHEKDGLKSSKKAQRGKLNEFWRRNRGENQEKRGYFT